MNSKQGESLKEQNRQNSKGKKWYIWESTCKALLY